jgi:hypothetical protein
VQLGEGVDLSAEHNYPCPPIMAVLLEPLSRLPPVPAALAWYYLEAAMALCSLFWVLRLVESGGEPFPAWARILVVGCSLKPILDDLAHANVNLFILFLVVAALTAYRGRRDFLAGAVLGLAIACKVTPALFVPYFAWKRSWRLLAGCALGLLLFLWPGVVPAARLGVEENRRQLASWYRLMVRPFAVEGKVTSEHLNQSLPGLVARLATRSPSFVAWDGLDQIAVRHDNVLELSPQTARLVVQGCLLLFALVAAWASRTPPEVRGWRLSAEFALVTLGMLLFSERTWKHHGVTLMLPFAVLVYALARARLGPTRRAGLAAVLVAAVALVTLPGLGAKGKKRVAAGEDPGAAKMAQVYGAYTWAFVLLSGGLVALLRTDRRASCQVAYLRQRGKQGCLPYERSSARSCLPAESGCLIIEHCPP